MAIVNTKSKEITDLEAVPRVMLDAALSHGRSRVKKRTLEVAAADDNNSVYRFFRLRSDWSIHSIKIWNDVIAVGTDYDLGLYEIDGGAVKLVNAYADALSMAAALAGAEQAFEQRDVDKVENKVWQDAGDAKDPVKEYDMALTGVVVGTAAGTISIVIEYTDGT